MQPDEPLSARDEIRVSEFGLLRCPSCGGLAAELLGNGHNLILTTADDPEAECRDGQRVQLTTWDTLQAAANISLADGMWWRETIALREAGLLPSGPPGGFTGLLGTLRDEP